MLIICFATDNVFDMKIRRTMTIYQARKLLGTSCHNVSDEELQIEIELANTIKEIFFRLYSSKINIIDINSNLRNNGK